MQILCHAFCTEQHNGETQIKPGCNIENITFKPLLQNINIIHSSEFLERGLIWVGNEKFAWVKNMIKGLESPFNDVIKPLNGLSL